MNIAVCPDALIALAPTTMMGSVRLGMPQLCLNGLSETWLLKELGHRHWMMLATLPGRDVPDFRDIDGAPVYAAFCALSVHEADFASLGENDVLTIASDIARVTRTQSASRHRLSVGGRAVGEVELVSAFVRRATGGGNHTVARIALDGFPPPAHPPVDGLAVLAAELRGGRCREHFGFALDEAAPSADSGTSASVEIDPCPSQDFNGAGFLYFSSFVAFIDRAEWHFEGRLVTRAATRARDVFFHGNIDPGERLVVRRLASRAGDGTLVHRYRLERASDGARMAEAFTVRAL